MIWCVYYDDGSTFSSDDGAPEDAPLDGVLGIGQVDDDGRKNRFWGQDFYFWTGDGWAAGNQADLERWLRGTFPRLKYGRWAPNSIWRRARMLLWRDW